MKAISLFSGALGLDLGLEHSGIEIILASEIDPGCCKTIKLNKPKLKVIGDINSFTGQSIVEMSGSVPDLIVGGPPCQSFSTAGKRLGFNDSRGNVLLKYIDLILEIKPQYAAIENVRGLLSSPNGELLFIVNKLREVGYGVSFNLYNSANFGSPQIRERVIIICSKNGDELPCLAPTHSNDPRFNLSPWRTLRDAVKDINDPVPEFISFPEKRLKYYRLLNPGQCWKDLPENVQKEAMGKSFYSGGGKTGFLRRLAWDKPSPTLVTSPIMPATSLAHPEELRPLSVKEYARIQEFPDSWQFSGSTKDKYRQIGNAVPLGLGVALGKVFINHSRGIKNNPPIDFPYSRYKNTDHKTWQRNSLPASKK